MPVLDTQVRNCLSIEPGAADNERFFLTAPVRWIDAGEDGEMTALGVGSIDGKQRKEPVATLHSMATRVATSSSEFQSQRTETVAQFTTSTAAQNQVIIADNAATAAKHQAIGADTDTATTAMEAVSLQSVAPTSRPTNIQPAPDTDLATASLHDQPVPAAGKPLQHPLQNGGPPDSIKMPSPPIQMERTTTEFMTPLEDPSDLKQLQ